MTQDKHTQGPWTARANGAQWVVDAGRKQRVASVNTALMGQEANARLIAAAPDFMGLSPRAAEMLMIAAKIIREHAPDVSAHYDEADCDGYCIADDCESAAEMLQIAIAKAKGETT